MANTNIDSNNARWSLVVSREIDIALRQFLANQGMGRKGDLSKFVEEAVRARVFELASQEAKKTNAERSQDEIETAIAEALDWTRTK